jgi:ATP-dependent Clp protease ATP-binding subunit ClpC
MGSFIFLGPSGVGKTLLSKALAKFMFGDEDALVQIDMSEYMEKHNASRLVGAPPGYVGYEEGGHLTEKVRRRPYSVVLLDEIEKAHPDIFNMLLQVMEEGRLTDSFGRHIDFRNVILIMTSNIGANLIRNSAGLGFKQQDAGRNYEKMKEMVLGEVERHFRPEFLNRIDELVVFNQLERADLDNIVHIEVKKVMERLRDRKIVIDLTPEALSFLVDKGYHPDYGARPLKRAIEQQLEDPLAEEVLRGHYEDGAHLIVKVADGKIEFEKVEKPVAAAADASSSGTPDKGKK